MADYSEKLKDPRWQRKRLEIMQRDEFKCQYCFSDEDTLTVHHKHYEGGLEPWEYPDDSLVTLCELHHTMFHEKYKPMFENATDGIYFNRNFEGVNSTDSFLLDRWIDIMTFRKTQTGFKQCMDAIYTIIPKDGRYNDIESNEDDEESND